MLSAFKNFLITFLVGALIFGVIGYFTASYVSDIVTGILDGKKDGSGTVINAPTDTASKPDEPKVDPNLKVPDGKSFTMLIVGTDYRPDMYTNYYHTEWDFQTVIDKAAEAAKKETEKATEASKESKPASTAKPAETTKNDTDKKDTDKKDTDKKTEVKEKESILKTEVRYINSTWITLVRADKENREYVVCYLSPETHVSTPFGEGTLGEIYGYYGIDVLCEYVIAMTGLEVDYRFVLDGINIEAFIESVGSVEFELLSDIYAGKRYHVSSATTVIEEDAAETESSAETKAPAESASEGEAEEPKTETNVPVLGKGTHNISSYSTHILNTFKEMSQSDIDTKSTYVFDMVEKYLKRFAGWSAEDLSVKLQELTVPEEGKEYDILDPYSEKTVIATEFNYEDVEYIHSMLGAVEYFTYTEFVYPGSYSDATKTFEPDIKSALEMFKKYHTAEENKN